jgi:hypothetical protein
VFCGDVVHAEPVVISASRFEAFVALIAILNPPRWVEV